MILATIIVVAALITIFSTKDAPLFTPRHFLKPTSPSQSTTTTLDPFKQEVVPGHFMCPYPNMRWIPFEKKCDGVADCDAKCSNLMDSTYCKKDLSVDELDCQKTECDWRCDKFSVIDVKGRKCFKLISGRVERLSIRQALLSCRSKGLR